jgi:MFS family permease
MVMIYNMTGPFIVEHTLHMSPVVAGYSSLILGLAWLTGGIFGKATINSPFYKRMVISLILQVLFVTAMLFSLRFVQNLYVLILFAFLIHVCAGFTFNNFFTYALSRFPKNAGIASGLSGGVNYMIVSVLSYGIVFILPAKGEANLAYSYLVLIIASVLTMLILRRQKNALG